MAEEARIRIVIDKTEAERELDEVQRERKQRAEREERRGRTIRIKSKSQRLKDQETKDAKLATGVKRRFATAAKTVGAFAAGAAAPIAAAAIAAEGLNQILPIVSEALTPDPEAGIFDFDEKVKGVVKGAIDDILDVSTKFSSVLSALAKTVPDVVSASAASVSLGAELTGETATQLTGSLFELNRALSEQDKRFKQARTRNLIQNVIKPFSQEQLKKAMQGGGSV